VNRFRGSGRRFRVHLRLRLRAADGFRMSLAGFSLNARRLTRRTSHPLRRRARLGGCAVLNGSISHAWSGSPDVCAIRLLTTTQLPKRASTRGAWEIGRRAARFRSPLATRFRTPRPGSAPPRPGSAPPRPGSAPPRPGSASPDPVPPPRDLVPHPETRFCAPEVRFRLSRAPHGTPRHGKLA